MDENKQKLLVRFNIESLCFAITDGKGAWLPPVDYGTPIKMALESNFTNKKIFGGGRVIGTIPNDKGKTFTATTNNVSDDYEIAMGRKIKTTRGLADIQQRKTVLHCIGFETQGLAEDGALPIAKTWLYMCTSQRPNESFDQTTDDINESSFDTSGEVRGLPLLNADGTAYKDAKGNDVYVWQMTATPDDEDFDTFLDTVVLPTLA